MTHHRNRDGSPSVLVVQLRLSDGMGNSLLKTKSDQELKDVYEKYESPPGRIKSEDVCEALTELFTVYLSRRQCTALFGRRDIRREEFAQCAANFESLLPSRPLDEPGVQFVSFGSSAPVGLALGADSRTGLPVVKGVTSVAAEVR